MPWTTWWRKARNLLRLRRRHARDRVILDRWDMRLGLGRETAFRACELPLCSCDGPGSRRPPFREQGSVFDTEEAREMTEFTEKARILALRAGVSAAARRASRLSLCAQSFSLVSLYY